MKVIICFSVNEKEWLIKVKDQFVSRFINMRIGDEVFFNQEDLIHSEFSSLFEEDDNYMFVKWTTTDFVDQILFHENFTVLNRRFIPHDDVLWITLKNIR